MSFRSKLLLQRFSELGKPVEDGEAGKSPLKSVPSEEQVLQTQGWEIPLPEILEQEEDSISSSSAEPVVDTRMEEAIPDPIEEAPQAAPVDTVEDQPQPEGVVESHSVSGLGDAASADAILKGLRKISSRDREARSEKGQPAPRVAMSAGLSTEDKACAGPEKRSRHQELQEEQIADYLKEFQKLKDRTEKPSVPVSLKTTERAHDLFDEFFELTDTGSSAKSREGRKQVEAASAPSSPLSEESVKDQESSSEPPLSVSQVSIDHMVAIPDEELWGPAPSDLEIGTEATDTYLAAVAFVLKSIHRAREGVLPDLKEAENLVGLFLEALESDSTLMLAATRREQEFAASSHSVNVAIIALQLARLLKYSPLKTTRVGIAALLHEIGVIRLPENLLHRPGKISPEEIKMLRTRPLLTNQILRQGDPAWAWLADTVAQVFEREDGSGFPLGLQGTDILETAKVIGIADLFDACIHKRPYRNALTGYQTLFELTTTLASGFPERVVKALIKALSLYPYNEYIQLDTGEIARVVKINSDNLSRPHVEILYDAANRSVEPPQRLDLTTAPDRYISRAIPVGALADLGPS